jgi:hypothetical protein
MPVNIENLSLGTGEGSSGPSQEAPNTPSPAEAPPPLAKEAPPPPAKEAPPAYSVTDPVPEPTVPIADGLTAAFSNLNIPDTPPAFPTADHCLAHLKLLNSLHTLKEDIGYTDGLFGLWDAKCEVLEGKERDAALAKTREKRWALYIARAVERFEVWWLRYLCSLEDCQRLQGSEMVASSKNYDKFTSLGKVQKWTTTMLPPLGMDHRRPGEVETFADKFRYTHGLAFIHA